MCCVLCFVFCVICCAMKCTSCSYNATLPPGKAPCPGWCHPHDGGVLSTNSATGISITATPPPPPPTPPQPYHQNHHHHPTTSTSSSSTKQPCSKKNRETFVIRDCQECHTLILSSSSSASVQSPCRQQSLFQEEEEVGLFFGEDGMMISFTEEEEEVGCLLGKEVGCIKKK